jgi:membrane protein YqaA with SNARE-associated domain
MIGLIGESRWGVAIVFLSACVFIPPLYPLTLAVAGTRMSVIAFGPAVLVGRMLLFLAIAFRGVCAGPLIGWHVVTPYFTTGRRSRLT